MKTRTCVVTVNYRNGSDTVQCIESLLRSDTPVSIVVVDNTPNDPVLARSILAFPQVRLLQASRNLGFGAGSNIGIEWALNNLECEFILLLNNDAVVRPDAISLLEGTLDERPKIGVVGPRVVFMDNPDTLCYGRGMVDWKRGGGRVIGFGGSAMIEPALRAGEVTFVAGCAMLVRRQVLEDIGGFDETFFMYEEDVDLSLRVLEAGYRIFYCPEALVLHKGHGSQRREGRPFSSRWSPENENYDFQVYNSVRNSVINARKHARGRDLLIFSTMYPILTFWRTLTAARGLGLRAFIPVFRGLKAGITQRLQPPRLFGAKRVTARNQAS